MPPKYHIVSRSEDQHAPVYSDILIYNSRKHRNGKEEENKYIDREKKIYRCDVYNSAVATEGPSPVGELLPSEAFQHDTADRDNIEDEGANGAERENNVQGDGGADIDQGEKYSGDKGNDDGIEWNMPTGHNLRRFRSGRQGDVVIRPYVRNLR